MSDGMKFKFGDIVINRWASKDNPSRVSLVIKHCRKHVLVTDCQGDLYEIGFEGARDSLVKIDERGVDLAKYKEESNNTPMMTRRIMRELAELRERFR